MDILINRASNAFALGFHLYVDGNNAKPIVAKDRISAKEELEDLRERARKADESFTIRFGPNIGPNTQEYFNA